jgi:hypothetical protein
MFKYTALCNFTANVENRHRQFVKGDVYETTLENAELDSYISLGYVSKEIIKTPIKKQSIKK